MKDVGIFLIANEEEMNRMREISMQKFVAFFRIIPAGFFIFISP